MTTTGQPSLMNFFTHFRVLSPPSATISTRITLCSTVDKDRGYNALAQKLGKYQMSAAEHGVWLYFKKIVYDKSCVKSNVLPGRSVTVASTTITNFLSLLSVCGLVGGRGGACFTCVCVRARLRASVCVLVSLPQSVLNWNYDFVFWGASKTIRLHVGLWVVSNMIMLSDRVVWSCVERPVIC